MLNEKLKKIYDLAGADVLFVEPDFLRRYLTGFYSTDGYAVVDRENCTLYADLRYFEAAEKSLKGSGIRVKEGGLKNALEDMRGHKTVGVPFPYTDLKTAALLKEAGLTPVDCIAAYEAAMIVKSDGELKSIKAACDIAEEAFLALLPEIKEGMTESETAALLEYNMRKLGASGVSFETICAFGPHGSVPHYETGNTKLKFGDIILIDFGCKKDGYCSDITRTMLFGDDKKHEEFKAAYEEVYKAHMLVKEKVTAGMTGREADAVARESLQKAGLAEAFTHSLGHGIGLNIHEAPNLSPRGETVLKDGMVFSDEPGVYFAGRYGIRIEDSCYMKDGRVHSFMSKTEKKLVIL